MVETVKFFNDNNYVNLKNFLDKEYCEKLVVELKKLVFEGKTNKDEQCPLSESVYGALIFDSLLEELAPNVKQATGLDLYPTYSYARLYVPGDELKIHTDRPSCEISVTLTLGFDGNVWPIYLGDFCEESVGTKLKTVNGKKWINKIQQINMEVGDAVLYRGTEKPHWRKIYTEGTWQAQVFLHYVDANGPHADKKYDNRLNLNLLQHKEQEILVLNQKYTAPKIFQTCVSMRS